jgi:hypothetical protein
MTDSLLTKYRPTSFAEVIGHEAVIRSLRSVLAAGSCRAFLLSGPSGVGKTTLASIIASMLGARDSLALVEIDGARFSGIDTMREVTELARRPPLSIKTRVIIIDECHALSQPAWVSLLKSIEEPGRGTYWIFCSTDAARLPETIRTRCTPYHLAPVPAREIAGLLTRIAAHEKMKVPASIIKLCVREAHGSPRQALVNLGMCSKVEDRREAMALLSSVRYGHDARPVAQAVRLAAAWALVQRAAADRTIGQAGVSVLMSICSRSDEQGVSIDRDILAAEANVSHTAVVEAAKRLERAGYVTISPGGGRGVYSHYRPRLDGVKPPGGIAGKRGKPEG